MKRVVIGSRGSKLAVMQAEWVKNRLKEFYPEVEFEIKRIKTKGDKILNSPLARVGGKGFFTKEIEEALLREEIDMAVHSMKDVPTEIPTGLIIGAVTKREDAHDALLSKDSHSLRTLPMGARIGTSSLRRKAQLLAFRYDLNVVDLRGNIDTRLRKLEETDLDGIIVAAAGLRRYGLSSRIDEVIPFEIILPAACQGALGIEIRENDKEIKDMVSRLNYEDTCLEVEAERAFLRKLGGGCQVPVGVLGKVKDGDLEIDAVILSPDGTDVLLDRICDRKIDAVNLGEKLACKMLEEGGEEILDTARKQ